MRQLARTVTDQIPLKFVRKAPNTPTALEDRIA